MLTPPPDTFRIEQGKDGWWYPMRDGDDMVLCRRRTPEEAADELRKLGLPLRNTAPESTRKGPHHEA